MQTQNNHNDSVQSLEEYFAGRELFSDYNDDVQIISENSELETNKAFEFPVEIIKGKYKSVFEDEKTGYYIQDAMEYIQLSNFTIRFEKWVKSVRNGDTISYYSGKILINKTVIPFIRLYASLPLMVTLHI